MARSVYVAGLDPGAGKSLVALGVAELLSRRVGRLGVFRPIADADDPILDLLGRRYAAAAASGVGTADAMDLLAAGHGDELVGRIVERYHGLAAGCEAVVVVGGDVDWDDTTAHRRGLPRDPAFDARLATEFGAPLVAVRDGRRRSAADLVEEVSAASHTLRGLGASVLAVVVNR